MNRSINRFLARFTAPFLLLFLALVTFPRTTEAAEKTVIKFQGRVYHAIFNSSGTFVRIDASQNLDRNDPSQSGSGVALLIEQTGILWAYGTSVVDLVFKESGNLRQATVQGTVPVEVFTDSGQRFLADVIVNVTWEGVGPITRDHFRGHSQTFNSVTMSDFTSTSRSAEAFGSVTLGTTDFTPNRSEPDSTWMSAVDQGTQIIYKLK